MANDYNELAIMTARLADGHQRGRIGPCTAEGDLWGIVNLALGVRVPVDVVALQLRRIGLEPEELGGRWFLDLGNAGPLVAAACEMENEEEF